MTLIAEDVFLVLVDDASGKPIVDGTKFPRVLAGAVVLELAMGGSIRVTGKDEGVKPGRLAVAGPPPVDPLLARAHALIGKDDGKHKPQKIIENLQKDLNKEIGARLAQQGTVVQSEDKVLGLFPTVSWPIRDNTRKAWAMQWLYSAIVDGTTPVPEISALTSLISAIDAVHKVLPGVDKKAAKRRAKEIAEGEWASEAVRKAVQDVNAVLMTAIIVPTIVAGSS